MSESESRKPDAVLIPRNYGKGERSVTEDISLLKAEFMPILQSKSVYFVMDSGYGDMIFATENPGECLNYGTTHAQARQPRYDWTDRGDGVLYGHLKEDV